MWVKLGIRNTRQKCEGCCAKGRRLIGVHRQLARKNKRLNGSCILLPFFSFCFLSCKVTVMKKFCCIFFPLGSSHHLPAPHFFFPAYLVPFLLCLKGGSSIFVLSLLAYTLRSSYCWHCPSHFLSYKKKNVKSGHMWHALWRKEKARKFFVCSQLWSAGRGCHGWRGEVFLLCSFSEPFQLGSCRDMGG